MYNVNTQFNFRTAICIYELIKFKLLNFQTLNYGEFESGYWGLRA